MESISIVYSDLAFSDDPLGVFTGDALFVGDVGRTDFYPDRAKEVAGMLYDSIFKKILPLGDHVLLWPAHGAGSVCGSGIADRKFSTLGYERRHNPVLRKTDRAEFIRFKVNEEHFLPPYFRRMEKWNLEGAPPLERLPIPKPLSADEFARAADGGMLVVDIRSPEAFAGAHVPKSFCLPLDMLPVFAGMFLPYDQPIGLIVEDHSQVEEAALGLARIGYDQVYGFLAKGLRAWETSGRDFDTIEAIHISELEQRLDNGEDFTLLDVRSKEEFESGHLRTAVHVYVGDLPSRFEQIPRRRPITTLCESGQRATIAAALLKRLGMEPVEVCLGSMAACSRVDCQVIVDD
jgi:hydroxyacylglutathione hydrolase